GRHCASGAERLYRRVLDGGAAAAFGARACGTLVRGARADLLVADTRDPSLIGIPGDHLLDALVFSSPGRPWRDVLVGGRWVVREHRHVHAAAVAGRFEEAMEQLWSADGRAAAGGR
ncbi:MAG: hypothetical protein ACREXI_03165, partial [Caldimonas sp.]